MTSKMKILSDYEPLNFYKDTENDYIQGSYYLFLCKPLKNSLSMRLSIIHC
jgi:hypothetical protein